jgi:hypothetical protein
VDIRKFLAAEAVSIFSRYKEKAAAEILPVKNTVDSKVQPKRMSGYNVYCKERRQEIQVRHLASIIIMIKTITVTVTVKLPGTITKNGAKSSGELPTSASGRNFSSVSQVARLYSFTAALLQVLFL